MFRVVLISLLLTSCASRNNSRTSLKSGTETFTLSDHSGRYLMKREVKQDQGKLVTRTQIFNINKAGQALESSVTVSKIGSIGKAKQKAMLPEASQFTVWLEKNKYSSNLIVDKATKKFKVKTTGPEEKWNGIKQFDIPKGRFFCFFSQMPECLLKQNILLMARKTKIQIYVIWDSFPFHAEQYEGLPSELITIADFYFSQKDSDSLRFELDLGSQIIFYHFDKQLEFDKLFWISQGISLIRASKRTVNKEQM